MNVQTIVQQIEEQQSIISKANEKIKNLTQEFLSLSDEDKDWVSVKKGADTIGVSVNMVYRKIDAGLLHFKSFGSKKFVRLSELRKVNDR